MVLVASQDLPEDDMAAFPLLKCAMLQDFFLCIVDFQKLVKGHKFERGESTSELVDSVLGVFPCSVRLVQNDQRSSHNWLFTGELKAIAKYFENILERAASSLFL